ncbi:MAG: NnrU family protein [Rhodobacteraceae bacterium]|nr:NnrU family protein [Paracoccaceae bacterium]
MTLFIVGAVIFFAAHFFPRLRMARAGLIKQLGEGGYKIGYSVVSLIGLALMIYGYLNWPHQDVYQPLDAHRAIVHAVMPVAFILAAASEIPSNLRNFVRHPLSLATLLWSGAHLTANGDQASLALFGGFGLYALLNIILSEFSGRASAPPRRPAWRDLAVIAAGLIGYGAVMWAHGAVFGLYVVG